MDLLDEIAAAGFRAVTPDRLPEVADECWTMTEDTGDGRYAVLAEMFRGLAAWWEAVGGVPQILASEVEELLRQELAEVLRAPTPAAGTERAAKLARAIASKQLPLQEWLRRGYVTQADLP